MLKPLALLIRQKDGSKKKVGTIGHVGTTSFFPSKNLGCYGDGGAIFTNDDTLAHTIRGIVNHGMYVRYHHDVVGVNSRLDSIQAGVLKAKLPHLDTYNKARQEAAIKYSEALGKSANIWVPTICVACDCHVFHQYVIRILNGKRRVVSAFTSKRNSMCYLLPHSVTQPKSLCRCTL